LSVLLCFFEVGRSGCLAVGEAGVLASYSSSDGVWLNRIGRGRKYSGEGFRHNRTELTTQSRSEDILI